MFSDPAEKTCQKYGEFPKCSCSGGRGCGSRNSIDVCLNYISRYECDDDTCDLGELCQNRAAQSLACATTSTLSVFKTLNKGYGVRSTSDIIANAVVTEYIGEVITGKEHTVRIREGYYLKYNGSQSVNVLYSCSTILLNSA